MYFLFLLCAEFFSKIRHLPFKEVKKKTLLQNYYQHEHPTLFMENLLLTIKEHLFTNWFYSQKRIVHACGFFREINLRNIFPFFLIQSVHCWMTGYLSMHMNVRYYYCFHGTTHELVSARWIWVVLRKPLIRIRVKAAVINTLLHQLKTGHLRPQLSSLKCYLMFYFSVHN